MYGGAGFARDYKKANVIKIYKGQEIVENHISLRSEVTRHILEESSSSLTVIFELCYF